MEELHKKLYFKLILWSLLIVLTALSVISGLSAAWAGWDTYIEKDSITEGIQHGFERKDLNEILSLYDYVLYLDKKEPSTANLRKIKELEAEYSYGNSNLGYIVYDINGEVVGGCTDSNEPYALSSDYYVSVIYEETDNRSNGYNYEYDETLTTVYDTYSDHHFGSTMTLSEVTEYIKNLYGDKIKSACIINSYIRNDFKADDEYSALRTASEKVKNSFVNEVIMFSVCSVLGIVCVIILMCGVSRKPGDSVPPNASGIAKFPYDVLLGIAVVVIVIGFVLSSSFNFYYYPLAVIFSCAVWLWVSLVIFCGMIVIFAAQIKTRTLIRCSLIGRICSFVYRAAVKLIRWIINVFRSIPLAWKTSLIFAGMTIIDLIMFCLVYNSPLFIFLWFSIRAVMMAFIIRFSADLKRLKDGGRRIAQGDTKYQIDVRNLYGELREHGQNLNDISGGIVRAVDERIKSERLKTELITNVSHDIKTPLTSIINYVDLLKKEPVQSQTTAEYIKVLDRQSARLKKLIDDLIEASKASSGSIKTELAPTSIAIIAEQAAGEYAEKMEAAGLELVMEDHSAGAFVMVDGRLLWRVLDNLLNNACKYSMRGSRVYMNIEKSGDSLLLSLMNISGARLNISSDELMERFVRGDSSRNTEGSGLGLSIAESLMKIMNGKLELSIEGDLFKAVLRFKIIEEI